MKLKVSQLRQIIAEEVGRVMEMGMPAPAPVASNPYAKQAAKVDRIWRTELDGYIRMVESGEIGDMPPELDAVGVLEAAKELMSTPKAVGALSRKLDLRGLYGYILDSAGFKMTGEGKNPVARDLGTVLGYLGTSSRNLADEISSRVTPAQPY